MTLPVIPVIDAQGAAEPAVASALAEQAGLRLVLDAGDWTYTRLGVRLAKKRSRVLSAGWPARCGCRAVGGLGRRAPRQLPAAPFL